MTPRSVCGARRACSCAPTRDSGASGRRATRAGGGPQCVHATFDGLQIVAVESGVDDDGREALGLVQAVGEGLAVAVLDELGGVRAVGQDEGAGDACLVVGQ